MAILSILGADRQAEVVFHAIRPMPLLVPVIGTESMQHSPYDKAEFRGGKGRQQCTPRLRMPASIASG